MKRRLLRAGPVGLVAALLLVMGAVSAAAGGAVHQPSTVYQFDDMSAAGEARLTRTANGVSFRMRTAISGELTEFGALLGEDWESGDATTVWFVVFNFPDECIGGCGEDEVIAAFLGFYNDAGVGLHYGTGHVAGGAWFNAAASLREWDTSGRLFGMPLRDAEGAEIHLVVRSHGPASTLSGSELNDALHSVDGGCATNTCGDPQFAVFLAP